MQPVFVVVLNIVASPDATPEEQRIKLISLAKSMEAHPDFKQKYAENADL